MTEDSALQTIQSLPDSQHLAAFAGRLREWLVSDLNSGGENPPEFTESRAKALLRAAAAVDDPTLNDFARLVENDSVARVALYDLLKDSALGVEPQVAALAGPSPAGSAALATIPWLSLAVAAFAWKSGYLLHQLDPASPPGAHSPAGQLLKRAAHYLRQQVQRSATERDKLGRKLSQAPAGARSLEALRPEAPIAPLPPHFRPPIPVRYPEVAREMIQVDPAESPPATPARGEPLVITNEDLPAEPRPPDAPVRMPPITIGQEQLTPERRRPPTPLPGSAVLMPNSSVESRPSLTVALRQMLGQEEMKTTKLHILVQEYPDGPGLYGLQVRVTCHGIKSYVAGTTDREGKFVCELPVRLHAGLTYDVDVTWPRDAGGDVERKSITLNADRTYFTLPFYRRLNAQG
ncbi:MAG: hypothetical protein L0332_14570 [Chloroflexi bacterium]|nr:hypothetical protein [Chloroflexota bacterium]MCI0578110.1 hypothetical protein [Chloroflexota bacterium]MCI0644414.1 hypothetical protein [Chloroflexota bacterium]MCI0727924.1 hypothetical protein [Chloroflexota bacterium]